MAGKPKDIIGKRFKMLTVVKDTGKRYRRNVIWLCRCDCGNYTEILSQHVNETKTCGCIYRDREGLSIHPLGRILHNIILRCTKKTNYKYPHYGGRGISVCKEWKESFKSFVDFAFINGWEPGFCTHRINNDGDYEPDNVTFLSKSEHIKHHWRERKIRQ